MLKLIFLIFVVGFVFYLKYIPFYDSGINILDNNDVSIVNLNKEPIQKSIDNNIFYFKDFEIEKKAQYDITARVLGVEKYRMGIWADLSPLDFALGWKEMSDPNNIKDINISQGSRWYYYTYNDNLAISQSTIAKNSANTHLIPSNSEIEKILRSVSKHDIVNLKGYLVNVYIDNRRGYWNTSLSRNDVADGSCEILFITNVSIIKEI